jgi:hypothetical protein
MNRTGIKFKGMSNFKTTPALGNESSRLRGQKSLSSSPFKREVRKGMGFWANAMDD